MMIAILDPANTSIVMAEVSVEDSDWNRLVEAGSSKLQFKRELISDTQPVPSATQVVQFAGYVVEATRARRTWSLREKTQAELDADASKSELVQLKALASNIKADIDAGLTAAPTTAAQAFVQIQDLKQRALRTDRVLLWLLKQQQ